MATPVDDKPMKILLSGGGSGGHITPLLAVADELKGLSPRSTVITVGERGGKFSHLTESHTTIDSSFAIFAGKFRRYHGESIFRKLLDLRTNMLNIRDVFYIILGTIQSLHLLRGQKPDVVFLKGGFAGVPIGLAAAFYKIPIVTHDSDALPGLANRIIARWATVHATGLPAEFYSYPPEKVAHIGVLVSRNYTKVNDEQREEFCTAIQVPRDGRVLFVTGGSLGSQRINTAFVKGAQDLLTNFPDLYIVHQVGKGNMGIYGSFLHERLRVTEFLAGMHQYSGAADLIITRAGANTIAEFGAQAKACIVIPSPFLAGGHQLKNAEYLKQHNAALVIDEAAMVNNAAILHNAIKSLLIDENRRKELGEKLHSLVVPEAAYNLSKLLLEVASASSK